MAIYVKNKKNVSKKKDEERKESIPDTGPIISIPAPDKNAAKITETIEAKIDINKIETNPDQPRKYFDKDKIAELVNFVKSLC